MNLKKLLILVLGHLAIRGKIDLRLKKDYSYPDHRRSGRMCADSRKGFSRKGFDTANNTGGWKMEMKSVVSANPPQSRGPK